MSACLPATSEPIAWSRPSARAPASVATSSAWRAGSTDASPVRDFREQGGDAQLGEEVEPIVRRCAVRAERDVDAAGEQRGDRRNARAELHVGHRTVNDVTAVRREKRDVVGREMHAVDRDESGTRRAQRMEPGERRKPVLLDARRELLRRLGEMRLDRRGRAGARRRRSSSTSHRSPCTARAERART